MIFESQLQSEMSLSSSRSKLFCPVLPAVPPCVTYTSLVFSPQKCLFFISWSGWPVALHTTKSSLLWCPEHWAQGEVGVPLNNVGLWALKGHRLLTLAFWKHLYLEAEPMFLILSAGRRP